MAYAETEILHAVGYVPPGPPTTEYGRRTRAVNANAGHVLTVITYDDAETVPAATPSLAGEIGRWDLAVSPERAAKITLIRRAKAARATLRTHVDMTNAEALAAVEYHARVLDELIGIVVNDPTG